MGLFFSRKAREERKNRGKQIDLEGEGKPIWLSFDILVSVAVFLLYLNLYHRTPSMHENTKFERNRAELI